MGRGAAVGVWIFPRVQRCCMRASKQRLCLPDLLRDQENPSSNAPELFVHFRLLHFLSRAVHDGPLVGISRAAHANSPSSEMPWDRG